MDVKRPPLGSGGVFLRFNRIKSAGGKLYHPRPKTRQNEEKTRFVFTRVSVSFCVKSGTIP